MSDAISIEHVSKRYHLGTISGSTLTGEVARWWARVRRRPDPAVRLAVEAWPRPDTNEFWALEDVSFNVRDGEIVGIVGKNGAGKSTLLKILSQVTAPTAGRVRLKGRIASLLEVGTGFHPDLTGRENVFLNGAIMGMTKREIRSKFDEIVAFSECEPFIDTPVKRYSSGMYVRLAFAVAAHLEPEILIVDEVLAVGDAQFQRKCLGKMGEVSRHGRTILFVSHSMPAITALCSRAIVLRAGRVVTDGDVSRVVAAYQADDTDRVGQLTTEWARTGTGKARFTSLHVNPLSADGAPLAAAVTGCDLMVHTSLQCAVGFEGSHVSAEFFDLGGHSVVEASTAVRGKLTLTAGQQAVVTFRMQNVLLKPGVYRVALWIGREGFETIDHVPFAGQIDIHDDLETVKVPTTLAGVYRCRFTHSIELVEQTNAESVPPTLFVR